MILRDRYLVVFSIATSLLSAGLAFVEKFIQSIHEIDLTIIFFSGIFIALVIIILLFFLVKGVLENTLLSKGKGKGKKKKSSKKK